MNWMVGTILVPSDGTVNVGSQLDSARAMARATGAKIVVAHVTEIVRGRMGSHPIHANDDELRASARSQVDGLRSLGLRAELDVRVTTGALASELTAVAAEHSADLIVVRRGRGSRMRPGSLGGLARRLGGAAHCAVLIVD